jgi:S-adenosylmethionine hydrolase
MNLNARKTAVYRIIPFLIFISILLASAGVYAFTTITILPGKLNNFRINVPGTVSAGSKFTVKLVALDDYGNIITDFANKYEGLNIGVNIGNNNGAEQLDIPASEFKSGAVNFDLSYKKAGHITVSALFEGIQNISPPIYVAAGPFHNLKITAPRKASAGEPFGVKVYAVDQYGNPIRFMPKPNGDIKVYLTGDNFKVRPRIIPANYIKNGSGKFSFISDRAGSSRLNFEVDYDGRTHVFISKNIDIHPSYFNKFLISTNIAKVPAGKPFVIKIVSIDKYGNVVNDVNKMKGKVKLVLISENGIERSSLFNFKSFNKGIALVKTVFNRVGTFSIYAKPEGINLKKLKAHLPKINRKIRAKSLLLYK